MLTVNIPMAESYDDDLEEFVVTESFDLELEHSLVSLSKWESKFEKPFLGDQGKTDEETFWYILAMTMNPEVPPEVFTHLTQTHIEEINGYINAKQTATWFREEGKQPKTNREIITAEVIYHWMIALNIDLDWENRHLNRLITLVRVCNEKNKDDGKKKPARARNEAARERAALNERRKQATGSNG